MLSRTFSEFVTALRPEDCPAPVRAETVRSVLNVVGTSIAASHSDAVEVVVEVATKYDGTGHARVPGRSERLDVVHAALATGIAAHLDDFDDTHLATVVHPAVAAFAAALSLSEMTTLSGPEFLDAVALGMEVQLRLAVAMTPWHYDAGWHITGTVGSVGAAVTAARVLGLDAARTATSMDLASSMSLGHRQGFGTMVKPLHPGRAAANGVLAAALARRGATASPDAFEAPGGYFSTLTPQVEVDRVLEGLGTRWELLDNTYKPYPCGIVSHPAIEAAELLQAELADAPAIVGVVVRCHPLVVELTGNPEPHDGLSARFSTVHGVAVGLLDGAVGLAQYESTRVTAPDVVQLRRLVRLEPEDTRPRDSAAVEVVLEDGDRRLVDIEHVKGSLGRPLTDQQLDDKVRVLVERTFPHSAAEVVAVTRRLAELTDLRPFLAAVVAE